MVWLRIRGGDSKTDIVVGICYRQPDEKANKVFKDLKSLSCRPWFSWGTDCTAARKTT